MARSVRIRNNTIGGFPICHRSLCGRLLHPFFHHALEILFGNYPYTELRGLGQFRRPHVVAREQIIRIFRDGREVAPAVRLYQRFQLIPAVTAERAGNGTYVTAIRASLSGQPEGMSGTLSYQVNLSGSGWLSWQENMAETGTIETGMPLEAIRMELTGQLKDHYDVYYSVFQNGSWTAPVKNGETAGTEGQGLRVDGIWVTVTEKDAAAPEGPKNGGIDPTRPMVALTFDDGPSKYTERILNSLEANGGRATFFMVGNRVASYASTVKRMADLGCETNSHTWAHTYLTNMSEGQILQSLNQTRDAIVAAGGNAPKGVRPPGGKINDASKAVLAKAGMPSIVWSVDTLDWKTRNAQKTIDTVLSQVKDGDIVLMHDLYEQSAIAAETLIPELTKRGYQLVTVSEMAELRGGMAAGHSYGHFR